MWKLKETPECDYENDTQTMRRTADECPSRKFALGIKGINEVTKEAVEWINTLDIEL